jgi:uncharacterized membrane protein YphA (DoxX/SURF4 family)
MHTKLKPAFIWLAKILSAVILLQTLFFKFTAAPEAVYISSSIGMEPWGRVGIGILELVAATLILIPATTLFGSLLAIVLMTGALFYHVTRLGISVQNDGGQLFIYALIVLICSVCLVVIYRNDLLKKVKRGL